MRCGTGRLGGIRSARINFKLRRNPGRARRQIPRRRHHGAVRHRQRNGRAASLTAIGDTVNVTSRLEGLAKAYGAQLVVSARVAEHARADLSAFDAREVQIRGRSRPLRIRVIEDARELPLPVDLPDDRAVVPPAMLRRRLTGLARGLLRPRS